MKRILLTLSILIIAASVEAQSFPTLLNNFRTYNNTQITTKTGPRSITPVNVGGNIDSTCNYILTLYGLIASAGDWQSTLAINNIATTSPLLQGGALYEVDGSGTERSQLGSNLLGLWSSTGGGFYGGLKSAVTTSNKIFYLPDYSTGNSTDDALVTHTSNARITVTNGTLSSQVNTGGLVVANSTTTASGALLPNLLILRNLSNPTPTTLGNLSSTPLTATRNWVMPDISGTVAMTSNISLDNALTGSPYTNQNAYFGKVHSLNPYSCIQLTLNADSSGYLLIKDTTNTNVITLATAGANSLFIATNGVRSMNFNTATSGGLGVFHLLNNGSTPSITAKSGAGTSPTISITGGDLGGTITLTTGAIGITVSDTVAVVTFADPFSTAPTAIPLTPSSAAARNANNVNSAFVDMAKTTSTAFYIFSGSGGLLPATTYKWCYTIIK